MVVALYACRLSDLGPDDRVEITCGCGHVGVLTAEQILKSRRAQPHRFVVDLGPIIRCTACRRRLQPLDIGVKWAERQPSGSHLAAAGDDGSALKCKKPPR